MRQKPKTKLEMTSQRVERLLMKQLLTDNVEDSDIIIERQKNLVKKQIVNHTVSLHGLRIRYICSTGVA